jgi:hypothetical protein
MIPWASSRTSFANKNQLQTLAKPWSKAGAKDRTPFCSHRISLKGTLSDVKYLQTDPASFLQSAVRYKPCFNCQQRSVTASLAQHVVHGAFNFLVQHISVLYTCETQVGPLVILSGCARARLQARLWWGGLGAE